MHLPVPLGCKQPSPTPSPAPNLSVRGEGAWLGGNGPHSGPQLRSVQQVGEKSLMWRLSPLQQVQLSCECLSPALQQPPSAGQVGEEMEPCPGQWSPSWGLHSRCGGESLPSGGFLPCRAALPGCKCPSLTLCQPLHQSALEAFLSTLCRPWLGEWSRLHLPLHLPWGW